MTQRNASDQDLESAAAATGDEGNLVRADDIVDSGPPPDDWDEAPPWQKMKAANADAGEALKGLSSAEITKRHVQMLNELIEQSHPLASEFLATARTVSPDAQGRDRLVSKGCKLAATTDQLIKTSARLRGGS